MTTKEKQVMIISSYITYLLSLMDKEQHYKASTIRLRDKLLAHTRKNGNEELVVIANNAWAKVLDKHKDDTLKISIAILVERFYMRFEQVMLDTYGAEIGNLVCRFTAKQMVGDVSEYAKDSYIVEDSLIDAVRKEIFDNGFA